MVVSHSTFYIRSVDSKGRVLARRRRLPAWRLQAHSAYDGLVYALVPQVDVLIAAAHCRNDATTAVVCRSYFVQLLETEDAAYSMSELVGANSRRDINAQRFLY